STTPTISPNSSSPVLAPSALGAAPRKNTNPGTQSQKDGEGGSDSEKPPRLMRMRRQDLRRYSLPDRHPSPQPTSGSSTPDCTFFIDTSESLLSDLSSFRSTAEHSHLSKPPSRGSMLEGRGSGEQIMTHNFYGKRALVELLLEFDE